MINHAYALNWLGDNGDPAILALMAESNDEAEKLCRKLERFEWSAAAEYRPVTAARWCRPEYWCRRAGAQLPGWPPFLYPDLAHDLSSRGVRWADLRVLGFWEADLRTRGGTQSALVPYAAVRSKSRTMAV